MIKRFMKSRWWHFTGAVTSLATAGYAVYMASAYHVFMFWILMASVFMTGYGLWKFVAQRKEA